VCNQAGFHAVRAIVTEGLNRERIEPPQPAPFCWSLLKREKRGDIRGDKKGETTVKDGKRRERTVDATHALSPVFIVGFAVFRGVPLCA